MKDSIYKKLLNCNKIIIGLSGGADSIALTHILLKKFSSEKIICVHVNHGIRGEEALRDENFVRDFCKKFNISLKVLSVNIPLLSKEQGLSTEECARKIRYEYFESLCAENDLIATAHNLNDNSETVIFNLTRGTGISGLKGIPETREKIIRPILDMNKEQILEYCKNEKLSFVTDSTNNLNEYSRNKIRNKVFPILCEINSNAISNISRSSDIMSELYDYININAENALVDVMVQYGINSKKLSQYHPFISKEVLKLYFKKNQILNFEQKHLNEICSYLNSSGSVNLPNNIHINIKQGILYIYKDNIKEKNLTKLEINKIIDFNNKEIETSQIFNINQEKINKILFNSCIDCDKIKNSLVIGYRKDGDKIRLANRNVTKTLKKLFNEHKIPSHLRDDLIIIRDGEEIVFAEKFGVSENYMINEETKKYFYIKIK